MLELDSWSSPHGVSFHIGSKFVHLSGMEQEGDRLHKCNNERTTYNPRHCGRIANTFGTVVDEGKAAQP